jgi:hypothetical protein
MRTRTLSRQHGPGDSTEWCGGRQGVGARSRLVAATVGAIGATVGAISRGPGVGLGDSSDCER